MSKEIERKIFLENLPMKYGIGSNKNVLIVDWENSIGYEIKFIYDNIEDFIKTISYNKAKSIVKIEYKNEEFDIASGNLKKCKLGVILNKFKKEYKYSVGDIIQDENGKGLILKQIKIGSKNIRGYLIKCLDCNNTYQRSEYHIQDRDGFKCTICSDGNKYPSKFLYDLLKQQNIDFDTEYSPSWCKYKLHKKMKQGRYDFLFELNNIKYIIETDGKQHSEEKSENSNWEITLVEQIYIDTEKDRLAEKHNIKIIRINCGKSELAFMKDSILNNKEINELFDLSDIDWLQCHQFALSNRVKEACDIYNNGIYRTEDIAKIMKMAQGTINKYLKQGYELNWCEYRVPSEFARYNIKIVCNMWNNGVKNIKQICKLSKLYEKTVVKYLKEGAKQGICTYNPQEEINKAISGNWKDRMRQFICIENGIIFNNAKECIKYFKENFNIKLIQGSISKVCLGKSSYHKGYHFKYVSDLTEEQIKGIQEKAKLNQVI
jgi:hypothetical protein